MIPRTQFEIERRETMSDECGGLYFLPAQFGMLVQMPPRRSDFREIFVRELPEVVEHRVEVV
jgi:hypothetical protein